MTTMVSTVLPQRGWKGIAEGKKGIENKTAVLYQQHIPSFFRLPS